MRQGTSLSQAYYRALLSTGKVVMLTGVTLAIGVATWMLSPIKFQADMGVLLAFMFVWNMVGALVLLPALAHFLLPSKRVSTGQAEAKPSHSTSLPLVPAVAEEGACVKHSQRLAYKHDQTTTATNSAAS
jgi:uncharacterized membrane protein YdfJ with MMPL/SSD domain